MNTSKLALLGRIQEVGREFHLPDRFPHRETGERAVLDENARDFAVMEDADGETLDEMKELATVQGASWARISQALNIAAFGAGVLFVAGAGLAMAGFPAGGSLLTKIMMGVVGTAFGLAMAGDFVADGRRRRAEAVGEALTRWEPFATPQGANGPSTLPDLYTRGFLDGLMRCPGREGESQVEEHRAAGE